eukprot:1185009-Prorocentrum_minimum.AAC.3
MTRAPDRQAFNCTSRRTQQYDSTTVKCQNRCKNRRHTMMRAGIRVVTDHSWRTITKVTYTCARLLRHGAQFTHH